MKHKALVLITLALTATPAARADFVCGAASGEVVEITPIFPSQASSVTQASLKITLADGHVETHVAQLEIKWGVIQKSYGYTFANGAMKIVERWEETLPGRGGGGGRGGGFIGRGGRAGPSPTEKLVTTGWLTLNQPALNLMLTCQ